MSLISQRTSLAFLVGGLFSILIFGFFTGQEFVTSLVLIMGFLILISFLHNPNWGIFLVIFIRPSIDSFSEQFSINLGKNLNFNAAAVFGILVVFLLSFFIFKNKNHIKNIPLRKSWILFLAIAFFSIFISINNLASIYGIIKIVSIFLIFVSCYVIVKKEKNPRPILFALIFSSIIPFLFASFQLISGTGAGGSEGVESRLFGTFSHPNPFASFVIIVSSMTLFVFLLEKNIQKKWLWGVLFFWGLIILGQTYARGAWLAFFIFLFVVFWKKNPKMILGLFAFSIILFFFSSSIQERVQDVYNPPADSSVRWRFEQWNRMYDAFSKKPLTGYGIGTETIVHEEEYGPNAGNQYTHNDFLRVAVETGIFGFLAYFSLLALALALILKNYLKEKNPFVKDFGLFVLALYLGLLSYSLTNNNLNETVTQWTMWGIIGATLALHEISKRKLC